MTTYTAPQDDTRFVLQHLLAFDGLCAELSLNDINLELGMAVYEEAAKLAADVLAPLNMPGDRQGTRLEDGQVREADGLAEAYRQFADNGWATLAAPAQFGGQGLPRVLDCAVNETWQSANIAFALCTLLTQGAVAALDEHADEALKQRFLPKLVSGEWAGTMNLTEAAAGSDLAAISARAVPEGEHYRISGQKIFISWGDQQMSDNILHLVLARLPEAPPGVKGISLFVVPKYLDDGRANDVRCIALEHKLGMHASPTCVMSFGDEQGAIGYLVGEAHHGLRYMFTMMNHARQAVGLQGLAISERAYQQARGYARERIQGKGADGEPLAIIRHADVQRMLMAMKSGTEAMRCLSLLAAAEIDRATADVQRMARVELMTPIVKGWMTELAQELTSLNVQVHGGMGYVEETGAAQHLRDARVLSIYEGTTGIQALDLIGRKVMADRAQALDAMLAEIRECVDRLAAAEMEPLHSALAEALSCSLHVRDRLLSQAGDQAVLGRVSYDFLMLMGYLCGGWLLADSALKAADPNAEEDFDPAFLKAKAVTAQFYAEHYLPRVTQHAASVLSGFSSLAELDLEQL